MDGALADPAWSLAPDGGPLTQVTPIEGAEPTEATSFRVVYDSEALYIGVWCHDREPDAVLAREMARDGRVTSDDYVVIVLDTFLDRRNGYEFITNANGARYDALITANRTVDSDWDTIWLARGSIDEEGWKAEIRIPFTSISFDPALTSWGFNISRRIKRKDETGRWSGARRQLSTYNVSVAGRLAGLESLERGIGLDLVPYVLGRYRTQREEGTEDHELTGGGDVRYRITPNLTASLSFNTDFAETEVDSRQINLTRFPLFFPEKREFFLQDAGIFRFGSLGSDLIPFFSRRIGLSSEGQQVPILVAGKLTGRVDSWNIGAINSLVDSHDEFDVKNAFVGRVSRNVFDQSTVGMILTHGNPNSDSQNLLAGTDFGYFTTEFLGEQLMEFNLFVLGSYSEDQESSDSVAFGGEFELPNDLYRVDVEVRQIGREFDAGVGFVPRKGIRVYETELSWRPRPELLESVRQLFLTYSSESVTDLSNRLETAEHVVTPLFIRFESFDEVFLQYRLDYDAPDEAFEISDGVVIPTGEYWWSSARVGFETASRRPYELEFSYQVGEFYDGERSRYSTGLALRFVRFLLMGFGYSLNQISLPGGDFETRLGSVRAQVNFTPELIWYNLLQYDNVSDSLGFNSRLVWEFRPGSRLFLVLNQNIDRTDSRLTLVQAEVTLKAAVTFRF